MREAAGHLGGGLHTEELTLPGFLHDVCATVQPLAAGSPFFRSLDLGVELVHPGAPAAHPLDDGTAVMLERGLAETVDGLGRDGAPYRRLVEPLVEAWDELAPVLLGPLPAARRILRAARAAGLGPLAAGARAALGDARSVAESLFQTSGRGPGSLAIARTPCFRSSAARARRFGLAAWPCWARGRLAVRSRRLLAAR